MLEIVQQLEERLARLIVELEGGRTRLRQLEVENDGLRITAADRDRLEASAARATAQIAEMENEITMLRNERDALLRTRDEARDAAAESDALRARLDETLGRHHGELEAVRGEAEVLRTSYEKLQADHEEAKRFYEQLNSEAENQLAAVKADFEMVRTERDALSHESGELRAALGTTEARAAEATRLQAERDEAVRRAKELDQLTHDLRWRLGEVEAELGRTRDAAAAAEEARATAQARAAQLEASATGQLEALRRENEEQRLKLNEFIARDQKARERLGDMIGRIARAEELIEQTELAIHDSHT